MTPNQASPSVVQGTKGFSSSSRMERMSNQIDHQLWKILKKEKLTDLSQFHLEGSFDEIPLFSREASLQFLLQDKAINEVLFRFGLKFLNSVIAYEQHQTGYFAALTFWDEPAEIVIPNLFFWCGLPGDLKEKLTLGDLTT